MGVVGREGVEVTQLTQATLNVGHVDLHIVLEAAVEWRTAQLQTEEGFKWDHGKSHQQSIVRI